MTLRRLWTRLQEPDNAPSSGGSTAATSSPAPSPAAPAPSAPSAAPAASGSANEPASGSDTGGTPADPFDFAGLVDYAEGKEPQGSVPPAEPPTPAAPAPSPVAAPSPAPASVQAPAAPAPAAPTEPPAAPQPQATANEPASSTQQPQPVNWEEHRKNALPALEKIYALSEQEVQDFQTNPGAALPKLAAMLHYNVTMSLQQAMYQYLPNLIQGQMGEMQARTQNENAFYTRWPQLKEAVGKDPKVEASINESLKAYRAANPKATVQDLIEKAGLLAMISLGLNPVAAAAATQTAPTPQAPAIIPGRPAGTGMQAHVPPRAPGGEPAQQTEADFYSDIANFHLSGGG